MREIVKETKTVKEYDKDENLISKKVTVIEREYEEERDYYGHPYLSKEYTVPTRFMNQGQIELMEEQANSLTKKMTEKVIEESGISKKDV
ncbi:MAG: hypothetical protein ACOCQD_05105 [archaeon]